MGESEKKPGFFSTMWKKVVALRKRKLENEKKKDKPVKSIYDVSAFDINQTNRMLEEIKEIDYDIVHMLGRQSLLSRISDRPLSEQYSLMKDYVRSVVELGGNSGSEQEPDDIETDEYKVDLKDFKKLTNRGNDEPYRPKIEKSPSKVNVFFVKDNLTESSEDLDICYSSTDPKEDFQTFPPKNENIEQSQEYNPIVPEYEVDNSREYLESKGSVSTMLKKFESQATETKRRKNKKYFEPKIESEIGKRVEKIDIPGDKKNVQNEYDKPPIKESKNENQENKKINIPPPPGPVYMTSKELKAFQERERIEIYGHKYEPTHRRNIDHNLESLRSESNYKKKSMHHLLDNYDEIRKKPFSPLKSIDDEFSKRGTAKNPMGKVFF